MTNFELTLYQNGLWGCIRPELAPYQTFEERTAKWEAVKDEYAPQFEEFGLASDDEALGFSIAGWHGNESAHSIAEQAFRVIVPVGCQIPTGDRRRGSAAS